MKNRGFTLIELIVGLLVLAIIMIPFIQAYEAIVDSYKNFMNAGKIYDALNEAMSGISDDIRGAEYIQSAPHYPSTGNAKLEIRGKSISGDETFSSVWEPGSGAEIISYELKSGTFSRVVQSGDGTLLDSKILFSSYGFVSKTSFNPLFGSFDIAGSLNTLWTKLVADGWIYQNGTIEGSKLADPSALPDVSGLTFLPGKGAADVRAILENPTVIELVSFESTAEAKVSSTSTAIKSLQLTMSARFEDGYVTVSGAFAVNAGTRPHNYFWFF